MSCRDHCSGDLNVSTIFHTVRLEEHKNGFIETIDPFFQMDSNIQIKKAAKYCLMNVQIILDLIASMVLGKEDCS